MNRIFSEKPKEDDIQEFARLGDQLPQERIEWMQKWIRTDQEIKLLYMWFVDFYAEYDQILNSGSESLQSGNIIMLFRKSPDMAPGEEDLCLVAESPDSAHYSIMIHSFAGIGNDVVLKWIKDLDSGKINIFLHSEKLEKGDLVLAWIGGHTVELVNGKEVPFNGSEDSFKDIGYCNSIQLKIPLCRIQFYHDHQNKSVTSSVGRSDKELNAKEIQITIDNEKIKVQLPACNVTEQCTSSVLKTGNLTEPVEIESGSCEFSIHRLTETRSTLYFFGKN